MIASLREHFLDARLQKKVCDFDDALRYSGTAAFVAQRTKLLKKLRGEGVVIADAEPQALHVHLVQAYLKDETRRRGDLRLRGECGNRSFCFFQEPAAVGIVGD